MNEFSTFKLLPQIENGIKQIGFKEPTPIQQKSIPILMQGKDLMGIAQTGTGKTAAFALPLLDRLGRSNDRPKPLECFSLILVPTRELAAQVHDNIKKFSKEMQIKTAVIYGGVGQKPQIKALKEGIDILVATPGRLEDLMGQGFVKFSRLSVLVLDEADHMLEIGFMPAIKRIVSHIPKQRQTLMFSATMPKPIEKLAQGLLTNPVMVETTPDTPTVDKIQQQVVHLSIARKVSYLREILTGDGVYQALIFSRTKHGADKLKRHLARLDLISETLHSNKSQNARQRTLNSFRQGKLRFLIATDIANRGIDVDGVSHVINYDIPVEPESYVHRIGRTGRAGREGIAISLCTPDETGKLMSIERIIKAKLPSISLLTEDEIKYALAKKAEEKNNKPPHKKNRFKENNQSRFNKTNNNNKKRRNNRNNFVSKKSA